VRVLRLTLLVFTCVAAIGSAQTTRRATNIEALLAYPSFYHTRPIVIVGTVAQEANGDIRASSENGSVRIIPQGNAPDGVDEIRGEFWDIGRMKADDPRLATVDLRATFRLDPAGPWPRPGEVTAIVATTVAAAQWPTAPSIRAIVLDPGRYLDQKVTITGQFGGRNLMGDLPDAPGKSRYDFVLRSADAAIWVSNLRPKGKDERGRDFELGLDARIDTGRWLRISGTVHQARGLVSIDGEAGSLSVAVPPAPEPAEEETLVRVPAAPAPEAIFSAPADGETDVAASTSVRIQFSRDLDPSTIKGGVHVSYADRRPEDATLAPVEFTAAYNAASRVLTVTFAKPLERFRMVRIELAATLVGTDKQPVKPWTLTFETGGN